MKKLMIVFFLFFTASTMAQDANWAIGLKIGEPLGLNVRKYFNDNSRAFDLNFGSYGFLYGRQRSYRKEPIFDEAGIMVQGLFHYVKSMGSKDKLWVYYGYGAQINRRNYLQDLGVRDKKPQVSVGPAVNVGFEFKLPENDLSLFVDAGGYLEIAPKLFFVAPNLNLGLRINLVR